MTFRSSSKWKYRWRGGGGECNFSLTILKENCLLLQIPINSSYTVDARITKPICMIPLCIQMLATYLKFSPSSSLEIIQILAILPKNAISVIYSWNWYVRPAGSNLPASPPPTLSMLESPNLYAWYPHAYRCWQRTWIFSPSSSFEIIQILVILPENTISPWIFQKIG